MNPDWYGTIYGDGSVSVKGLPGTVSVSVDMDITDRSAFTFVLNDTEAASDYHFPYVYRQTQEGAWRRSNATVCRIFLHHSARR